MGVVDLEGHSSEFNIDRPLTAERDSFNSV